jgi:hypothetical protein
MIATARALRLTKASQIPRFPLEPLRRFSFRHDEGGGKADAKESCLAVPGSSASETALYKNE